MSRSAKARFAAPGQQRPEDHALGAFGDESPRGVGEVAARHEPYVEPGAARQRLDPVPDGGEEPIAVVIRNREPDEPGAVLRHAREERTGAVAFRHESRPHERGERRAHRPARGAESPAQRRLARQPPRRGEFAGSDFRQKGLAYVCAFHASDSSAAAKTCPDRSCAAPSCV